ncbi:DUF3298 and DUF4163 domain-containing protein [Legionella fairfieldensis]|uniref:DUF3298 and DUF4163 domain-containing protein n=1 Tax=Legionella fairfieldensis TaxID=45064 RepID=UPI00048E11CE|nr:DUF3298 and DUF4163 domain-containing protein [Legionella fairfieldensis]
MKKSVFAILLLCFSLSTIAAQSSKTVVIKKSSADLEVQIKYPQGFYDHNIDKAVRLLITKAQKDNMPVIDKTMPVDVPGKSGLYIDYKTKFQNKNALSLLFTVSSYNRGAAHPNHVMKSLNFLNGQVVTLDQLFKPDSNYLTEIANFSRNAVMKKKLADADWVAKGTSPATDNYENWYFTSDGLAVVFDTYQVAPYVYGPQTVQIPRTTLAAWLRPEVVNAVWGK